MNILLYSLIFPPDVCSNAYVFADLADELQRRGHTVTVITTTPHYGGSDEELQDGKASWYKVGNYHGMRSYHICVAPQKGGAFRRMQTYWRFHHRAFALLKNESITADAVLAQTPPPITVAPVCRKLAKKLGAKSVLVLQDLWIDDMYFESKIPRWVFRAVCSMERRLYGKLDALITLSDSMKGRILNKDIAPEKLTVIANPVNPALYHPIEATEEMRKQFGVASADFVISYVGNIGTAQDLTPLIEYARGHQNDGTIILIAGNGSREEKYRSMAEGLANVRFLGFVTRDVTAQINAVSDVCTVMLSEYVTETCFPSKLCTLMAMARPIALACRKDCMLRDYVSDRKIGVSAPVTDSAAFAAALDALRVDPERRAVFGKNAYETAMHEFLLEAVGEQYEQALLCLKDTAISNFGTTGLRARLEYALKHNAAFYTVFQFIVSTALRIVGLFTPVDEKAILFSGHGRRYNDSPRAIYEYLISQPKFKDYTFYWALEKPDAAEIPGSAIKVQTDTLSYFLLSLRCKYWVTCVNIERGMRYKSKRNIYLNTWHGTPIKSVDNDGKERKKDDFSYMDFFCVCGEFEKKTFQKAFNLKEKQLIYSGLPRNDALYHTTDAEIQAIRKKLDIPDGKKVLLYAPTWRDSTDNGKTYVAAPPIHIEKWKQTLDDQYVLLLRTHPYTNKLLGVTFDAFVRDCTNYPEVNDLFKISDMLISDYSAAIFDYAILERPIISFAYDYERYERTRGFALNPKEDLPGGVVYTEDEVLDRIANCDYAAQSAATKAFKERFLEYGGNATQLCVEKLFSK